MADGNEKPTPDLSQLEKFAAILQRHRVEYLVIGGCAESLMGSPRVTYDVDLCYRRTPENLARLADALTELKPRYYGAPPDLPVLLDARALSMGNNYTLETPIGRLDLLGWVEPLGAYESLLPRSETFTVDDFQFRTIGLDDLIRVKEHINRTKDHQSLMQLLAIRKVRNE